MSTETHEKAFWEDKNLSFKIAAPEDDLLHRQFNGDNRSPTLTETQFFGFSVPEENIHADNRLERPRLRDPRRSHCGQSPCRVAEYGHLGLPGAVE